MNPGFQAQDQLNASEPTALCVMAREINLWTYRVIGESNPGPSARAASDQTTGPSSALLCQLSPFSRYERLKYQIK